MEDNLAHHLPSGGEVVPMKVDVKVFIHLTPGTLSSEEPISLRRSLRSASVVPMLRMEAKPAFSAF